MPYQTPEPHFLLTAQTGSGTVVVGKKATRNEIIAFASKYFGVNVSRALDISGKVVHQNKVLKLYPCTCSMGLSAHP